MTKTIIILSIVVIILIACIIILSKVCYNANKKYKDEYYRAERLSKQFSVLMKENLKYKEIKNDIDKKKDETASLNGIDKFNAINEQLQKQ